MQTAQNYPILLLSRFTFDNFIQMFCNLQYKSIILCTSGSLVIYNVFLRDVLIYELQFYTGEILRSFRKFPLNEKNLNFPITHRLQGKQNDGMKDINKL